MDQASKAPSTPVPSPEAIKQGIIDWTETNVGGKVIRVEQVRRWRPIWRVDVDINGVLKSLAFKGPRDGEVIPYPVEHELKMLQLLRANGIPVPPVHGLCPFPPAVVMDWMPGGRDPGMVMMAAESESAMGADRWAASLEYMDHLAAMHKIDPAKFLVSGLPMPSGPQELALNGFERFYALGKRHGVIDPLMEFCRVWLQRNVPQNRQRISFVTGDCCQFLSDGPDVTTLLDMEIGYLGDHLSDLACFVGRHPVENLGDIGALFKRYEESFGEKIDVDALAYQVVVFMTVAFVFPVFTLPVTPPGGDWVESQVQVAFCGRRCAEALADVMGVELNDQISLPAPVASPLEDMAINKLVEEIENMPATELFPAWKREIINKIPRWLASQLHYGRWAEQEDLNDLEKILGVRPANNGEGDKALCDFIAKAGPEHDEKLVRFFYRRTLRQCHICVGPDAPENHIIFARLEAVKSLYKA